MREALKFLACHVAQKPVFPSNDRTFVVLQQQISAEVQTKLFEMEKCHEESKNTMMRQILSQTAKMEAMMQEISNKNAEIMHWKQEIVKLREEKSMMSPSMTKAREVEEGGDVRSKFEFPLCMWLHHPQWVE